MKQCIRLLFFFFLFVKQASQKKQQKLPYSSTAHNYGTIEHDMCGSDENVNIFTHVNIYSGKLRGQGYLLDCAEHPISA